ncbi:ABC-type transport system involved in multi-copper enzyme maturation, permease component [Halanaeroarchaeum sp. HSR-CO]|uniref:ABC transporter permease n=1 Tax=Halanaeroarchaeum sp. HSR-CO TaxID=2866382 RepID=UPI00217E34BC|nr:ABC transporter permease [Halanaeroarchaeum sp. HSR-CO]UWG47730.1 ABC-type transport system involved in multi-copper enzyme maturation, permease component [Halanaeroarchaeum sp. HSR-CO]
MTDILKYEARQRSRGTLTLIVVLSFYLYVLVYMFPTIASVGDAFDEYVQALPDAIVASFGVEAITTIEGFLSVEVYQFIWVLMMGLYFAYLGGDLVAGEIESGRIDLILATPVSRKRFIVEKYLSLLVPIVAINLVMPVVVLAAVISIGEAMSLVDLVVLHAFSIPYLLLTAAIGLVLSVLFDRSDIPQRAGLGIIFALFTLESVTANSDFEWLGLFSPTHYFDPTEILVNSEYDVAGALILLAAAGTLLIAAAEWFRRRDV